MSVCYTIVTNARVAQIVGPVEDHQRVAPRTSGRTPVKIAQCYCSHVVSLSERPPVVRSACRIRGPVCHRLRERVSRLVLDGRHSHRRPNYLLDIVVCGPCWAARLGHVRLILPRAQLEVARQHTVVSRTLGLALAVPRQPSFRCCQCRKSRTPLLGLAISNWYLVVVVGIV